MKNEEISDAIRKDAIIIGTGQAGKPLSLKLAGEGWDVLLIEKSRQKVGGTCINTGCTPTKTLIASAGQVQKVREAGRYGIGIDQFHIDFSKIQRRKDYVVESFRSSIQNKINKPDRLHIIYGEASFKDKHTVHVETENQSVKFYTAPYIFINAGARPAIPAIKGLNEVSYFISTSILDIQQIPERLLIIGGSYIGMELGQMFHRLGSEVAILERSGQILSHEDQDISESLMNLLREEGMEFHLNASVKEVRKKGNEIQALYEQENDEKKLWGTHLLLATGRVPNTDLLNLEAAGLTVDGKGYLHVDEYLKTNVDGIYALGDIKGGPQFTHIAYNDFVIVSKNILENKKLSIRQRPLPYCVYTDPQLGRIGLTEKEAREQGIDYKLFKLKGSEVTRGIETGKPQGLWKALVEPGSNKILGAAILCTEGGEVASVVQMAMEGGISGDVLSTTIFSHPSYTESLNILFQEPA